MSTAYKDTKNPATEEENIVVINRALELGVTFLDTSDVYGPFTNEELVGRLHDWWGCCCCCCTYRALPYQTDGQNVASQVPTRRHTGGTIQAHEYLYAAGKAVKGKREKYVLATKFGVVRHPDGKGSDVVGTPEHVRSAIEASLKRLQTTYVDLYYQHRIDRKVGIETTVKELKVGKVRGDVFLLQRMLRAAAYC